MKHKSINNKEKNGQWKGDKVGYGALHIWIKSHLEKPQTCRDCNQPKRLDLANISQEYKRDLSDWEWLCRKCHMIKDGRLKKLLEENNQKGRTPWNKGLKFSKEQKQKKMDGLILGRGARWKK